MPTNNPPKALIGKRRIILAAAATLAIGGAISAQPSLRLSGKPAAEQPTGPATRPGDEVAAPKLRSPGEATAMPATAPTTQPNPPPPPRLMGAPVAIPPTTNPTGR